MSFSAKILGLDKSFPVFSNDSVAQLDRASACGAEGRWFESTRDHHVPFPAEGGSGKWRSQYREWYMP